MTAEQETIDASRIERLEQRLQVLEDTEAIRTLKTLYAAHCDDDFNYDAIAALFAEDAVWETRSWAAAKGARPSEIGSRAPRASSASPFTTA